MKIVACVNSAKEKSEKIPTYDCGTIRNFSQLNFEVANFVKIVELKKSVLICTIYTLKTCRQKTWRKT